MKKLLILVAGVVSLGLGACNRQSCPAYGNHASVVHKSAPITASTATTADRL
jgi:hypothetical protein